MTLQTKMSFSGHVNTAQRANLRRFDEEDVKGFYTESISSQDVTIH
jgi:hypothetical protein